VKVDRLGDQKHPLSFHGHLHQDDLGNRQDRQDRQVHQHLDRRHLDDRQSHRRHLDDRRHRLPDHLDRDLGNHLARRLDDRRHRHLAHLDDPHPDHLDDPHPDHLDVDLDLRGEESASQASCLDLDAEHLEQQERQEQLDEPCQSSRRMGYYPDEAPLGAPCP
jgi:hypothetical protein